MSAGYVGWHFLAARGVLRDGKPALEAGVETTPDEAVLGESGLHASADALVALGYAPGCIVRRVRLLGPVARGGGLAVSRRREVLWTADADGVLRGLAGRAATSTATSTATSAATGGAMSAAASAAASTAVSAAERASVSGAASAAMRAAERAATGAAGRAAVRAEQSRLLHRALLALGPEGAR